MTIHASVLSKLDWQELTTKLTNFARTEEGQQRCSSIQPNLDPEAVRTVWRTVSPLKTLAASGYRPPLDELPIMGKLFRDIGLGHILAAEEFIQIGTLLGSIKQVQMFAADFGDKCPPLARIRGTLYPLPTLAQAISKTLEPDGTVRDDATPELAQIRKQKITLRKRIEEKLKQLIGEHETESYLQDKFFTVRADRYVLPMRLDGRGRVEGSIHDTSASGQTLYIEPKSIQPMNDQLLELELAEKLEILKIFRNLSAKVATDLDTLKVNYEELVLLDFFAAQAALAATWDGGEIEIVDEPVMELRQARHPLLHGEHGIKPIANDVILTKEQSGLVISGPNAGGKTVVLKTVGLLHTMLKAGLLIPADSDSKMSMFNRIYLELGDAQSLTSNLSTFSGHLLGLKPVVEESGPGDLVLLDELCVGTEPNTGAAIAQSILENLANRGSFSIVTTHFDNLKVMAIEDTRFRNGSMEFSTKNLRPTYQLILDAPGQSYGVELAEQLGFPQSVLDRAREIRGASITALDKAVQQLMDARDDLRQQQESSRESQLAAEQEKSHWEVAVQDIESSRAKAAQRFGELYEHEMQRLRDELAETLDEMKGTLKQWRKQSVEGHDDAHQQMIHQRQRAESSLKTMDQLADSLIDEPDHDLPGSEFVIENAQVGDRVYVLPLNEAGTIRSISMQHQQPIEVGVGPLKVRMNVSQLRQLETEGHGSPKATQKKSTKQKTLTSQTAKKPELVIQTPTNSLDLRGYDVNNATDKMWLFIDRAIMRGETAVIVIHGHGTDRLKQELRRALTENSPYPLEFRPGNEQEGGDGVTVVFLG